MTDWTLAACAQIDPELWFPIAQPSPVVVATCHTCPIRRDCAEATLDYESTHPILGHRLHGYAGGLTARARLRIIEKRRAA